jgi:hypothetical protein
MPRQNNFPFPFPLLGGTPTSYVKGLLSYDNKRARRANVRVRLDKAVACPQWRDRFSDTQVLHLI